MKSYWHDCENFGDRLTPYLIEKISGENVQWVPPNYRSSPLMVTGSILGSNIHRATVWGTGCAFKDDLNPNTMASPSWEFNIIATRGKLSKQLVEKAGHKPTAYGDPGLILPRIYQPNVEKKYSLGLVCSWVDYEYVSSKFIDERIAVINTMGPVETIINRMMECDTIISSALHGLVAAVAYGIPTAWAKFSDKMIGDGFKYHDFSSCLETPLDIINLESLVPEVENLINQTTIHNLSINVDELFDCCPFRKKEISSDSCL
jgi:pyruvyltransferase